MVSPNAKRNLLDMDSESSCGSISGAEGAGPAVAAAAVPTGAHVAAVSGSAALNGLEEEDDLNDVDDVKRRPVRGKYSQQSFSDDSSDAAEEFRQRLLRGDDLKERASALADLNAEAAADGADAADRSRENLRPSMVRCEGVCLRFCCVWRCVDVL